MSDFAANAAAEFNSAKDFEGLEGTPICVCVAFPRERARISLNAHMAHHDNCAEVDVTARPLHQISRQLCICY
jgi:hypothetical protein